MTMLRRNRVEYGNLYAIKYITSGSGGKTPGRVEVIAKVRDGSVALNNGFLIYAGIDTNGEEYLGGWNLEEIHSFRVEKIKDE